MLDLLNNKEIFDKVDKLREERGWSYYELAMKAGVATTTIYNWKERMSSPTLSILDAVCEAFGMSVVDFLLDGDKQTALTQEQREILNLWNELNSKQKKALLELIKTM